jgi:hypothetical protein
MQGSAAGRTRAGLPGRIRTCDQQLRRLLLYPLSYRQSFQIARFRDFEIARFSLPAIAHSRNREIAKWFLGWALGFEPRTFGSTIRRSNRLNYAHHIETQKSEPRNQKTLFRSFWALGSGFWVLGLLVGARGFEPPTPCSQSRCATRLRYTPTRQSQHCPPEAHSSVSTGFPDLASPQTT